MSREPDVILASGSPRRRELLSALISRFTVLSADIPEPLEKSAIATASGLAAAKALVVGRRYPESAVIGADTVVFDSSELFGKPVDADDARRMLRRLRGRRHQVVTAVAVARAGWVTHGHSVSDVWLADLDDPAIDAYVASGDPLDKAGAYAIQASPPVVARWDGCYCGVMGLPLWLLSGLLGEAGVATRAPHETVTRCGTCPERPVGTEVSHQA